MPPLADDEYKLLARRAVTNLMPLMESTPAQSLYVDSFRRGRKDAGIAAEVVTAGVSAEMAHWERSGLGAKQMAVHRGALRFGHSFTVTEVDKRSGEIVTKGLSALNTAAVFEDPANDQVPFGVITVEKWSDPDDPDSRSRGRMWDDTFVYFVTFAALGDLDSITVSAGRRHGATTNPVTRFAASVDLEGRTIGVIEPIIALQDRINQTVFDLLVAQTYSSTEVRTVSGMAPPLVRDKETGEPIVDDNGNFQPVPINHNARRFLFAEDPEAKFGSLPGSPLDGFISAIGMGIQHLSALAQVPPHYLLGQIANLSAEALQAAETSLQRRIEEFRHTFGESWERVFRLAAELAGESVSAADFAGEVIWRDVGGKSLAQAADALGKLHDQLQVPVKVLWRRIPDITEQELIDMEEQWREDDAAGRIADTLSRATPSPIETTKDDLIP